MDSNDSNDSKRQKVGLVDALSGSVASVQSTMGSAVRKMTDSLSQSVGMMNKMNDLMEEYVLRSLETSIAVASTASSGSDSSSGRLAVTVTLRNVSALPLSGIVVGAGAEAGADDVALEELVGGATAVARFEVADAARAVDVAVRLPSPGTGKELRKAVQHLVTMPEERGVEWNAAEPSSAVGGAEHRTVSGVGPARLRAYLRVDAFDALNTAGGDYCLPHTTSPVHLHVDRDGPGTAVVRLSSASEASLERAESEVRSLTLAQGPLK